MALETKVILGLICKIAEDATDLDQLKRDIREAARNGGLKIPEPDDRKPAKKSSSGKETP